MVRIIKERYSRKNPEKENRMIKNKFKKKFRVAAKEDNLDKEDITNIITSDEVVRNLYISDNWNRWCGNKVKVMD
mgnify:CR=1 FL=1